MSTRSTRSAGSQITQRGITQGNVLVDPVTGLPINVVEDLSGKKRLCVDADLSVSEAIVEVKLDAETDAVRVEDPDSGAYIKVEPDGSINVNCNLDSSSGDNVAISGHPYRIFIATESSINALGYIEVFTYTSVDSKTRISLIEVSIGTPAVVDVRINGTTIRRKRTSPLERDAIFKFEEHRALNSGDVLKVHASVERLFNAPFNTFTSLEGYLI